MLGEPLLSQNIVREALEIPLAAKMRILLYLMGAIVMVGAITMSPPEPNALEGLCTGFTTAVSVANSALAMRDR